MVLEMLPISIANCYPHLQYSELLHMQYERPTEPTTERKVISKI